MIIIENTRIDNRSNSALLFLLYLFVLQSPLEQIGGVFSYIDEAYGLLCILFVFMNAIKSKSILIKRASIQRYLPFLIFIFVGLLSNIIYQYQIAPLVMTDLLTNIKFYLAIITTIMLVKHESYKADIKFVSKHARFISAVFFTLLFVDIVFKVFPAPDSRYGFRTVQLFYPHSTYLAGAAVFLIAMLTLFYKKGNEPYILMDLLLMASTLRSKAIAAAVIYVLIICFAILYQRKIKIWHIFFIAAMGILIAWQQIYYYYFALSGHSARSVLTLTSLQVMKDYFPIGTGFATYGSHTAAVNYSPVYEKYGFRLVYELSGGSSGSFFDDTFWPIILGQTGFIGLVCYLLTLKRIILRAAQVRYISRYAYAAVLFVFAYLFISSSSEPSFNNSIAIPLAVIIGYSIKMMRNETVSCSEKK